MEPTEVLKSAWAAVEEANLPAPLHEKAFELAVAMFRGSQPSNSATSAEPETSRVEVETPGPPKVVGDGISKLSHEADISEAELDEVLYFDAEGNPHVTQGLGKVDSWCCEQLGLPRLWLTPDL